MSDAEIIVTGSLNVATHLKKCNFVDDDSQAYPMRVQVCQSAITHFILPINSVPERRAKKSPWKLGRMLLFVFLKGKF